MIQNFTLAKYNLKIWTTWTTLNNHYINQYADGNRKYYVLNIIFLLLNMWQYFTNTLYLDIQKW